MRQKLIVKHKTACEILKQRLVKRYTCNEWSQINHCGSLQLKQKEEYTFIGNEFRTTVVSKQTEPPPVAPASHLNTGFNPGCSASDPYSCYCEWESRRCPNRALLRPCIHIGTSDKVSLAPVIVATCGMNQKMENLCLYFARCNCHSNKNN